MKLTTRITKYFFFLSTLPLLAIQEQTANNYFESMNQSQQLSIEQLLTIQNEIYNRIQLNQDKLLCINKKSGSLIEKWQELLQVILPIQMEVIKAYNLGGNQLGL